MQTNTFWLNFSGLSLAVTLKIRSKSRKTFQLFIMSKCYIYANLVKSITMFSKENYVPPTHQLVQEIECRQSSFYSLYSVVTLKISSCGDLENKVKVTKI